LVTANRDIREYELLKLSNTQSDSLDHFPKHL